MFVQYKKISVSFKPISMLNICNNTHNERFHYEIGAFVTVQLVKSSRVF